MKFKRNQYYYYISNDEVMSVVTYDYKEKNNNFFEIVIGIDYFHKELENNGIFLPEENVFTLDKKISNKDMMFIIESLFSKKRAYL